MTTATPRTTVAHPDFRPGCGEKRGDRGIVLCGEAAQAYTVWAAVWGARLRAALYGRPVDPYKSIRRDELQAVIDAGGLLAELVQVALNAGLTRPIDVTSRFGCVARRRADYEIACELRSRYAAQVPPPVSLVPAGYADETCRHGRRFNVDCPDCGA